MNTNKIATGSVNKKLLAALAVLAVAFVVLAAIPAAVVDSDSDAASGTIYVSQDGATDADGSQDKPYKFTDVFGDGFDKTKVSTGNTIVVLGAIKQSAVTFSSRNTSDAGAAAQAAGAIGLDLGVTIRGQAYDGKDPSITGYVFEIRSFTGNLTIRDIAISDGGSGGSRNSSSDSTGILFAGYSGVYGSNDDHKFNVTLSDVDLTITQGINSAAFDVRTSGNVTITGSTFKISTPTGTTAVKTTAVMVYNASTFTFTNNNVNGYVRGVNIDCITSTTTSGNTMELTNIDSEKGKAYNIATDVGTDGIHVAPKSVSVNIRDRASDITYTDSDVGSDYMVWIHKTLKADYPVAKYESSLDTYIESSAAVKVTGSMAVSSGTTMTVASSAALTIDNAASLTVASGAALKVAGTVTITTATSDKAAGTVTSSGTIAKTSSATLAGFPSTITNAVVTAYDISSNVYKEGENTKTLSGPTLVYAGETISVGAEPEEGYAVSKVFLTYSISGSPENNGTSVDAVYNEARGVYVLTVPSIVTGQTHTITQISDLESGACTVTYVPVDAQGNILPGTQYVQGLEPEEDDASAAEKYAPTLVSAGYVFSGTWLEKATSTVAITNWPAVKATGTIVYGLMEKAYAINIADASNGTVESSPADAAKKDASVVLTVAADDGYEFSSVKVVDASGKTISTSPVTAGSTYKFTMPASAVTVTVVFKELHTVTLPAKAENDAGSWTMQVKGGSVVNQDDKKAVTTESVQGKDVTLKVTIGPNQNYALRTVTVTGASGAAVAVTPSDTENEYTFKMPDEDVTISYEYAAAYTITWSVTDPALVVSTSTIKSVESNSTKVAVGTTVTVKATPSAADYTVSKFGVISDSKDVSYTLVSNAKGEKDTAYVSTYTFVMPEKAAEISAEAAQAYIVKLVEQAGSGNVKGPSDGYISYEGEQLAYTVLAADKNALKTITVTLTGTGASLYKYVYDVASKELKSYAASTTKDSEATAVENQKVITPTTAGYTIAMQKSDVQIAFEFEKVDYYTITLPDDGSDVKIYSDSALKTQVDTSAEVAAGTYYIVVSQIPSQDVNNASATYAHDSEKGVSPAYKEGEKIYITLISQSAEQAIYRFTLTADTKIAAGYTDHYSVITIADGITNGKLALNDGTKDIKSGDKVKCDTVLTLVFSDVSDGYVVDTVSPSDVVFADGKYTYTVGMEDAEISVSFAQGYSISVTSPTGVALSAPAGAVVDRDVKITYTESDGYVLKGAPKVVYGAAAVEQTVTKVAGENTYTFKMPAGDVTITAESESSAGYTSAISASLVADTTGVHLMVMSTDGKLIPAGAAKITVTYSYSVYDEVFGGYVQETNTMDVQYTFDGKTGYAYIAVDFSAQSEYSDIIGASAAVSVGSLSYNAATIGFTLPARA